MTWLEIGFILLVYVACVCAIYGLVYFAVSLIRGVSSDD